MSFPQKGRQGSFSSLSDDGTKTEDRWVEKPTLIYHESARSIVFRDQVRRATMEQSTDSHHPHHQRTTSSSSTHSLSSFFQPLAFLETNDAAANVSQEITPPPTPGEPNLGGDEDNNNTLKNSAQETAVQIHGFTPVILPLPALEYTADDNFTPLLETTNGEMEDNIANADWTVAEREVVNMLKDQRAVVKTVKNGDWTALLNRFRTPKPQSHYSKPSEHDDIGPHEGYPFNSFVTSTSML